MYTDKTRPRRQQNAQEKKQVSRFVTVTYLSRTPVNIRMYDEYDDTRVIGIIEQTDPQRGRFMVDGEWFHLSDIIELGIQKELGSLRR